MAVSSFAGGGGGSRRRRSRTNTNSYAQAAAQQNRQKPKNTPKTYQNPYAQAAAAQQQPAVDPLTNMLSQQQQMMMAQGSGSMGAQPSMAEMQGSNTVTAPANQQPSMAEAQGASASQPANMPPPPPPPPPAPPAPQPTMAQMQGTGAPPAPQPTMAEMQGGGSVIPQPTMAQMQGTGNDAPLQPATQPTMAEMQGGGNVAPQPTMAQMQGSGQPPTPRLSPGEEMAARQRNVVQPVTTLTPEQEMALAQGGGGVPPGMSPGEAMAMAQNAAQNALNNRGGSILGLEQLGVGPSMADAQTNRQPPMSYAEAMEEMAARQGSGQPSTPTLSPGEEMAMRQGGGTPPPAYTSSYEQAALLQRGTPTMSYGEEMAARQSGGMSPGEEMAARQGAGLPDVSGYTSPYEQAALAQGGDVTAAPSGATDAQAEMFARQGDGGLRTFAATEQMQERADSGDPALEQRLRDQLEMAARQGGGYVDPYADAAAQQIDTGLRTFSSMPQFNENAAELEAIARRQDAGLQTFAAPGSRYNRGAEQLRRQAEQRPSDTLQDRLEQAYMGRIDATDDPILASQRADQRLRQEEAQKGLVEQLSRYGVLRGGGDTASALIKMSEGNERNRLALEAAAAQRRQGDLRDALSFDQTRSAMDIAQRGQSVRERAAADQLLDTELARDVTRAGQTGRFQGMDTLAAQEQRQRMALAERAQDLRERTGAQEIATSELGRDVTRAGLTGQFQDQDTLQAQEQALRMDLARAGVTGELDGAETLAGERQRRELALGEGAQATRDRLADEDVASSELARDVTRAGLTGQYQGQDTLEAQLQAQQMDLASAADRRAEVAQRAGLLGEVAGEGSAPARTTLAGRELALREDIARAEDLRAQQAAESDLYGQVVTGTDTPIATLQGQRTVSDLDTAALAREATEAGLTGEYEGEMTADERDRDLSRRIAEAGVTGRYGDQDTIQSQVIESSLQNEALNRGLARAGATGQFREEGDTGPGVETLESRLRTAGLTGQLDDDITLAGREARQDLIGSILAASDPTLKGRTDSLAEALTKQLSDDFGLDDVSGAMRIDAGNATPEEVAADLFPRLDGMSEEQVANEYRRLEGLGYDMGAIEEQVEQRREAERRKQAVEEARRRREERERNDRLREPTQEEIDAEIDRIMRERDN